MMRIKKRLFFYTGIISLVSGVCFLCDISKKPLRVLPDQSLLSGGVDSSKIENLKTDNTVPERSEPGKWVNSSFVLLPKPSMFRRFGYELYRCMDTSDCVVPDTFYELSNRRLKYDSFCCDTLVVTAVTHETDGEWLIAFLDKRYSIKLFTRTKKSALQEMVYLNDFEAACKRWRENAVFSRKGVISITVANGNLSSVKVRRYDSLKVFDVRYGLSPLPVNPIWLMVTTRSGVEGFIPVRYSWTNVMTDQVFDSLPWCDDILELNPVQYFNWDAAVWEVIENQRITIGMNKEQVFMSWGRPLEKVDTTFNSSRVQCWNYTAQKLYFNDNGLISIEDQGSLK